jgi:hypothetical protein
MGANGKGIAQSQDAQSPDVFQSRMSLADAFFETGVQALARDFHMPVQQRRGKELHLLASETRALLVAVCGQL